MILGDNRLHFKTNVQLKSIIGKDLINNDNIAVLELVKNSYDAGSQSVDVVFKNLKKNDDAKNKTYSSHSTKILIKDFGSGMDYEDLTEKWLNIAYSTKKKEQTLNGRILAGAKGVGRFSCDRLGQFLDLYTKKEGKPLYHLSIDWNAFEIEDKKDLTIQDIEVKIEEFADGEFEERFGVPLQHGTFLEISRLRSKWISLNIKGKLDIRKLLDLRRYLEKLIHPNQVFQGNPFVIELIAEDFKTEDALRKESKRINGVIKNLVFEKLDFTTTVIESAIDPGGQTIKTSITDKGRKIFEVVEKNVDYDLLRDIKIVVFYLNPYAKVYFKRETGIRSVDFGSIFLFINGFRVNPLGDYGDDWLRMEVRKGQGHAKSLGTREVVGRIEINDANQNFKIISSREGIVKDKKFEQIVYTAPSLNKGYFYKTLKRLEKFVVGGLDWDKTTLKAQEIERFLNTDKWEYDPSAEKYRENQASKDKRILELLSSIILVDTNQSNILSLNINTELMAQLLLDKDDKARERFNKLFSQNPLYSKAVLDKATWDTMEGLQQELEKTKKKLEEIVKEIVGQKEQIKYLEKEKKKTEKDLEEEKKRTGQLKSVAEIQKKQIYFLQDHLEASKNYSQAVSLMHQLGISSITIDNIIFNLKRKVSKGKLDDNALSEALSKIVITNKKISAIASLVTKANIQFNTQSFELRNADLTAYILQYIEIVCKKEHGNNLKIHIKKQINENFIKNFNALNITMLFDNLFDNSAKARASAVTIEVISYSTELIVKVRDDGKGIPPENAEKVFEFGFTTTPGGSGVGLFHVKQIVEELNGEISLNQDYDKGCEFIIKVKK